ncbi:MAG: hypothetical protein CO128_02160 [Ignavibacteriales bacterium CG_4_9_14_3_um_filter_30_11]|nr:MAG: hypothetical protein CO128_02160 [Ignavibacteriales bacterium CG_4_9_14_3_um_filter_30_11]
MKDKLLNKELNLTEHNQKLLQKLEENIKLIEELKSQRDFNNTLIHSSPAFFTVIKADGKVMMMNNSMLNALGYSESEVIDKDYLTVFVPESEREELQKIFQKLSDIHEHTINENHVIKKDGSLILVKWHGSPKFENKKFKYFIGMGIDITDQKKKDTRLEGFKKIFAESLDEIYIFDSDTYKFVYVNKGAKNNTGYSYEELINLTLLDINSEFTKEKFDELLLPLKSAQEKKIKFNTLLKRKDDSTYNVEVHLQQTIFDGKDVYFAIVIDTTEQKQNEILLKESEKKYKDLFDKSEDAILIIKNEKFVDCNQATVSMLRYNSKEELLNTHPSELSPEIQPDGKPSFDKAEEMMHIAYERGSHCFEWAHKKADGEVFPVEVLLTDVSPSKNEKILHTVWRDITDRKIEELKQKAIFKISELTFIASDMSTLYKKIHEILSELLPVKNIYISLYNDITEQISFPYFVDEFDPPQTERKLKRGLTEYVLRKGEAQLIDSNKDMELRANGEVEMIGQPAKIWLGVPLKISSKTIGVLGVQDYDDENAYGEDEKQLLTFVSNQIAQVIERKQSSVQLNKYSEELREANKAKDKFFSIIAHDLKSPFQGLLGYSQILSTEYETLSEEERMFFINNIDLISKSAYTLLEDLLTWSRIQTDKLVVNKEVFNLMEYLTPTIDLLKQTANNKEIKLTSSIDPKSLVRADKNMVQTAVRNIISNAIKFTNKGGEITIVSKLVNNFIEIYIEDNGVGIADNNLKKLFKIDENITTKGTANEEGTGLGLLLCKEMIEKQGGEIFVESEIGKGSKFKFTIPSYN